jgi:hypothetical protein
MVVRENLIDKDTTLLVFDTSALLDIYRYSITSSKKILDFLKQYNDIVWLPKQVMKELTANRDKVKKGQMNKYKNLSKNLNSEIENVRGTILSSITNYKKYNFSGIDSLENELNNKFNEFRTIGDAYKQSLSEQEEIYNEFIREEADKFIQELLDSDKFGEGFNVVELMEILKEGELRYKYEIPPGYKDEKEKEGIRKFGDLILWKELLKKAQSTVKKRIIFVLSDTKPDWFQENSEAAENVREELLEEFRHYNPNSSIQISSMSSFISEISENSDNDILVELRKKKVVRKLSENIIFESVEEFLTSHIDEIKGYLCTKHNEDEIYNYYFEERSISEISVEKKNNDYLYQLNIEMNCEFLTETIKDIIFSNGTINAIIILSLVISRNDAEAESEFVNDFNQRNRPAGILHTWSVRTSEYIWSGDHDIENSEGDFKTERPYTTCPDCGEGINRFNDAGNGFCNACTSGKDG